MIKTALKDLRKFFRSRSAVSIVRRFVPRSKRREFDNGLIDRRQLFEIAHECSGLPLNHIVEACAAELEIPMMPSVRTERWIEPLYTREQCERSAVCPLVGGGSILGVLCVEPQWIKSLPQLSKLPTFLGSWTVVQAGILAAFNNTGTSAPPEPGVAVGLEAISAIIRETVSFNASSAQLNLGSPPGYSIILDDGRTAAGDIRADVASKIAEYLTSHHQLSIGDRSVAVTRGSEADGFQLSIQGISAPTSEAQPAVYQHEDKSASQSGELNKILLVDDNRTFGAVLERYLAKLNVETRYAAHGDEAFTVLNEDFWRPDLVICDIHMPVMNGFEFVRRCKADPRFRDLPLLMLTSDSDVEAEIALLSYGVEAFVGKQEDPRVLSMHARRILDRSRAGVAA